MQQTTSLTHCERCGAEVLDIGSREDGEVGWEYCPNCDNPRIEDEDYKDSKCSTCVPEMGRDRPKDAWFEARRVGEAATGLFCYDCVELFAVGRTVRKL